MLLAYMDENVNKNEINFVRINKNLALQILLYMLDITVNKSFRTGTKYLSFKDLDFGQRYFVASGENLWA